MDQNDKVRNAVVSLLNCQAAFNKTNLELTRSEDNLHAAEGELARVITATGKSAVQYGSRQFVVEATGRLECILFKGLVVKEAAEAKEE